LDQKKGNKLIDWVLNYIQSSFVNSIIERTNLPKEIALVINVLTNLDKISIVQMLIAKMGVYKFAAYAIYFLFFA
jgi:hypothetical protein